MNTSEKIVSDPANAINGIVQHYRISEAAKNESGVEISGTPKKSFFRFTDGSTLSINHLIGDYVINPANHI